MGARKIGIGSSIDAHKNYINEYQIDGEYTGVTAEDDWATNHILYT